MHPDPAQKTHKIVLSPCIFYKKIKCFQLKKQDYQAHKLKLRLYELAKMVHMTTILQ